MYINIFNVVSYVAQGLMVAVILAEMSFGDLESMDSGASLPLQPREMMHDFIFSVSVCFLNDLYQF